MSKRANVAERQGRMTDEEARQRMLAGIPVTQRRLDVAGVRTAVMEAGDGPPMVLLHGGIETGGVVWVPVVSRLAERYRLVVPDVPGLGASEPIDRRDDAAISDWLAALIQLTCEESPTLVGHSLGGSLAARFAVDHGDLLRELILYAAPGVGHYRIPLGLLATAIQFNLHPSERANARFAGWALLDPARTRRRDPEWYDAFMAYGLSRGREAHVKATMRRLVRTGSKQIADAALQSVTIPTSLLWGRKDRMVSLQLAERASSRLGWPLHVVEDAGHVPHIEQPEGFLRALDAAVLHR